MNCIEVADLHQTFCVNGKPLEVLKNACCLIRPSDFVIILGKSGSGKTTLLNLMAGLDRPTEGQIYFEGVDITKLSLDELARWRAEKVGVIFQSYNLLPFMTSIENAALPLTFSGVSKKKRLAKAESLLREIGLNDRICLNANLLSGGEQQRVTIARALINDPAIIIADEPTGDLDEENATEVMKILYASYKERKTTVIMATHNADYVQYADQVIRIENGELTFKRKSR